MATRQRSADLDPEQLAKETTDYGASPAVLAAGASVLLSWYYFFLKGDEHRGLFVGLWPPTILAFASYFNQREMRNDLQMLTQPGSTIRDAIESVVGNR